MSYLKNNENEIGDHRSHPQNAPPNKASPRKRLEKGIEEKSRQFTEKGSELYAKA
jgi:hypothetical protein